MIWTILRSPNQQFISLLALKELLELHCTYVQHLTFGGGSCLFSNTDLNLHTWYNSYLFDPFGAHKINSASPSVSHLVPQAPSTFQVQDKQKAGSHSQALTCSLPTTFPLGKTFLLRFTSVWSKGKLWTPHLTGQLFSIQVSKQDKVSLIQFYEPGISNSSNIAKTHRQKKKKQTKKQNKPMKTKPNPFC